MTVVIFVDANLKNKGLTLAVKVAIVIHAVDAKQVDCCKS